MKTSQDMIKDLTDITVEQEQINKYLSNERSDLDDANFCDPDLTGTDLTEANLGDANLAYANLSNANITEADLSKANLCDADLRGVKITKQQLKELTIIEDIEEEE